MTETYELATDITYGNLKIYRRMRDGILKGYKAVTDDGYVMYDKNDKFTETDPETNEEKDSIYYYTQAFLPTNFNFVDFSFVVVSRNTVDENYIF